MMEDLTLPVPGAERVRVLVLSGYGLNCEAETAAAFTMLGARVDVVHVADLIERRERAFAQADLVVFIGGFSFGDHIASGRVLANLVRDRLSDALVRHVDDGGLVLGICNGFQTLVKLAALPGLKRQPGHPLGPQEAGIAPNDRLGYRNDWVRLRLDPASPCVFTRELGDTMIELPSRHGEGKLIIPDEIADTVAEQHLVPLRYVDGAGQATEAWPANPNGSPGGAAGLCDRTGRVFGLMPHPEAYLYPENHPDWRLQQVAGALPRVGRGLALLAAGVRGAQARP